MSQSTTPSMTAQDRLIAYLAGPQVLERGKSYPFAQFTALAATWFRAELLYGALFRLWLDGAEMRKLAPSSHAYLLDTHVVREFTSINKHEEAVEHPVELVTRRWFSYKLGEFLLLCIKERRRAIVRGDEGELGDPEDMGSRVSMLRTMEEMYHHAMHEMHEMEGAMCDGELPLVVQRDLDDLQPKTPEEGGPEAQEFHGLVFSVNYELGVVLMLYHH